MASLVGLARRYPATTLVGTAASALGAAYYAQAQYAQTAALQRGYARDRRAFPIASVSDAARLEGTFPSKSRFTTITLEESHMVNHNVKLLRFKLPDGDVKSGLKPITSLLTKHTAEGAWLPTLRPYTPIDNDEPGHITLLVKKYPNGKGSGHLHSMKPGDTLSVNPIHELDYKPNQHSHLSILAGGAGITPFVQIIRAVMKDTTDKTSISLVYANSTEKDILLKSEFDQLAAEQPERFKVSYVVTKPSSGGAGVHKGHMTRDMIEQSLPAGAARKDAKILVCGPPPMVAAVAGAKGGFGWTQGSLGGILKEIGLDQKQVQKF